MKKWHNDRMALWQPTEGKTGRGRRRIECVDNFLQDAGLDNVEELRKIMEDRVEWRKHMEDMMLMNDNDDD